MDWQDIPVFIVNRNRLEAMRTLIDWLRQAGMRKIVIIDNQSDYPPLLQYYGNLPEGVRLLLMNENHGPYVLWQQGVHKHLDTPYIVTDSDLIAAEFCPNDLVPALLAALARHPDAGKAGPGLRIDNLPDSYREVDTVRKWESQFWEQPLGSGCYAAPVDTTFALYPAGAEFSRDERNIRLGYPYLLEHTPWYSDEGNLGDEETFYRSNTSASFSHWSVVKKDSRVAKSDRVSGYDRRPKVLHLGGGHEYVYGWTNADANGRLLDLKFDPAGCPVGRLDLPENSFDGIYIGSSFTMVDQPHELLDELYRVVRPGARLVVRVPHASSDQALEDPRSCKAYVEGSFAHFSQTAQARPSNYDADWQVMSVELGVGAELAALDPVESLALVRQGRNLVQEMLVSLVAIKPARAPEAGFSGIGSVTLRHDRLKPFFAATVP